MAVGILGDSSGGGAALPDARLWLADDHDARDYPASPDATYDDEFADGVGSGPANGLDARWSWRNQGAATATFTKAGWLTLAPPAQSGLNWRIIELATFLDGTYEALVSLECVAGDGIVGGIVLVDAANGDLLAFGVAQINTLSSGLPIALVARYSSVAAFQSTLASPLVAVNTLWLRVAKTGTTLEYFVSNDGIGWRRLYTHTDPVGATRIGIGVTEGNNTGLTRLHVAYFRKVA